jgi:SAM-dependent methyltransferase
MQDYFWEYAGRVSYDKALFANEAIKEHITARQWHYAIETALLLGLNKESRVLELGCGDGSFAENITSSYFKYVDAFDKSKSAINQAMVKSKAKNVTYHLADMICYGYKEGDYWDGAFMMGFIHHIKDFAPDVVSHLAGICPRIIVLEPNGDNLIRKCLELLPSYRRAGEDSFRLDEILTMFKHYGYKAKIVHRFSLIPPFLPQVLLPFFKRLEAFIEPKYFLNKLCSTYVIGFAR